jgi:hypothetical protein
VTEAISPRRTPGLNLCRGAPTVRRNERQRDKKSAFYRVAGSSLLLAKTDAEIGVSKTTLTNWDRDLKEDRERLDNRLLPQRDGFSTEMRRHRVFCCHDIIKDPVQDISMLTSSLATVALE